MTFRHTRPELRYDLSYGSGLYCLVKGSALCSSLMSAKSSLTASTLGHCRWVKPERAACIIMMREILSAPVAQLDRATDF